MLELIEITPVSIARATRSARAAVAGPDRAREAVDRVVGEPHRLLLALERDHAGDRAEDLLARRAVVVGDRGEDGRREPVAGPVGGAAADRDRGVVGDVGGDRLALAGGDQRPHLGLLVERVADPQRLDLARAAPP